MTNNNTTGPLKGIKVLDLSRILAGPSATQLLGDLGADVVKVERPNGGDDTRKWGPPYVTDSANNPTSESGYYLSTNRNKRSLAVDIAAAEGAALVQSLAAKADIVVENFKKDGLKKYGLDYAGLSAINPKLIYCSITGFGQTGPNSHRPGYDLMIQGMGGIMSLTGPAGGQPHKVGVAVADIMTGMYAAAGILAALHHRDKTGEGQYIDLALIDSQIAWLANQGVNYLLTGQVPQSLGNAHPNIVPYQVFPTEDGYIIIAVGNDGQFAELAAVLGHGEWGGDSRFATNPARLQNKDVLLALLAECTASWKRDELLHSCEARGIPAGPVNNLDDVFAMEQVAARDMLVKMPYSGARAGEVKLLGNPLKFSATPVDYRYPPPKCGEHSEQILKDWLED